MTNEKAISKLRYQKDMREKGLTYQVSNAVIDTAISALEKQIPEPPYLDKSGGVEDWFFCPNCNHNDVEYKDKYCRRCGQELDWRK